MKKTCAFFVYLPEKLYFCIVITSEAEAQAEAEGWDAIYRKALSTLCLLTLRNLAVPNFLSKTKQRM
ncbi:MAG: hypothetical protein II509_02000, partial [Prevotella sp.]|nr:hypothetical protein [Prevotella sp.]